MPDTEGSEAYKYMPKGRNDLCKNVDLMYTIARA